jgi:sigma-70-like protein
VIEDDFEDLPSRPKTRGDCVDGPRPCPWVSCRYHLLLDVSPDTGRIKLHLAKKTMDNTEHDIDIAVGLLEVMQFTCALDAADDRGGMNLVEVAAEFGWVRERARQIETAALQHLRENTEGLVSRDVTED